MARPVGANVNEDAPEFNPSERYSLPQNANTTAPKISKNDTA
jgi:hypothetical protein